MRTALAGLALAALLGADARAQKADDKGRDAGKQETVRGVIAGVTVAGEMAIDHTSRRAQTVETTYLTVVGSPAWSRSGAPKGDDVDKNRAGGEPRRQNVYVISLGPKTEVRDSTALQVENHEEIQGNNPGLRGKPATTDALEVGDRVRVTFDRRDPGNSDDGGRPQARKHGRHRTYFGDATSINILSGPDHRSPADRKPMDKDHDDDKDRVKDATTKGVKDISRKSR